MHPFDDYDDGPTLRPRSVSYRRMFLCECWGTLAALVLLIPMQLAGWLDPWLRVAPPLCWLPGPGWWLIGVIVASACIRVPLYYVRWRFSDRCTALTCNAMK